MPFVYLQVCSVARVQLFTQMAVCSIIRSCALNDNVFQSFDRNCCAPRKEVVWSKRASCDNDCTGCTRVVSRYFGRSFVKSGLKQCPKVVRK